MYTVDEVLAIADAYASEDDWGIDAIYPSTLREVLRDGIEHGLSADALIAHASHYDAECKRSGCPAQGI